MLSAGIQTDEATLMLAENRERSRFQGTCHQMYHLLVNGETFAEAMRRSGSFPNYAIDMVETGERSGHLEQVLRNLEMYYDEEDRLFAKMRSSVGYPAALLCIMSAILAFTVLFILPVFSDVYSNMAGTLAVGSFSSVSISQIIGWIALGITVFSALMALLLVLETSSTRGRQRVMHLLEHIPQTKQAMYQLALSRFTAALATLVSSGIDNEEAMERAIRTVDHPKLKKKLKRAAQSMSDLDNPRSLTQAISEFHIFEPLYARMLNVGMRSGNTEETLAQLSATFFDDAVRQIDRALDSIEPALAAFMTIAVGATLIAVMLPLVGVMSSIG
jgi:type IV pilus assembly protein PilC